MGHASSALYVRLDKPTFYAGETVTGVVVLNVPQGHSAAFKSIKLKVTGVEKTYFHEEWTTHDSQRGTQRHSTTKRGKNVVLKHIVDLCGAGQFEAGGYQWPISFTLPANLPGSFRYSAHPHTGRNTVINASIEYKVKATLDVPGMFKADIKNKSHFELRMVPHTQPLPLQGAVEGAIKGCCCVSKGMVAMRVDGPTNTSVPGGQVPYQVAVDNRGSVPIQGVHVQIVQQLQLDFSMSSPERRSTVMVDSIGPANVQPGSGDRVAATLVVPPGVEATSNSRLIKNNYTISAVCAMPGCCTKGPSICVPLVVNDPTPHFDFPPMMQPPPGWAPQMMQQCSFVAGG